MAYPLVKFTDSAAAAGSVRLDLNVDSGTMKTYPDADTIDLGTATLLGDPDALGVEYGLREITFDLIVKGTRAQATEQMSLLARELVRENNWLMYQQDATAAPVWFELYKSQPGTLSLREVDNAKTSNYWRIGVTLHAEAAALGERVTQSSVTVTNNPSSGTNRCAWTLPTVTGDVPAPCRIQVNPSSLANMPGYRWMISHAALDAAYTPIVWQVGASDGFTAGTDTGASAADADYSGGSYRAVSFATNTTLVNRLTGSAPTTPTRGRYKVMVRIARSDQSSTFSLRFGQNVGGAYILGDTVTMERATSVASEHATYVDLGEFNFPRGSGQVPDSLVATVSAPDIVLQMGRLSGSGSARIDCFFLVPVDIKGQSAGSTLFSEFTRIGIELSGGLGVWDGDEETFWAFNSSAGLVTPMPENEGGYPSLVPGATNVIHLLQQVNGAKPFFGEDSPDDILFTTAVVVSYHPRWLYIGDN